MMRKGAMVVATALGSAVLVVGAFPLFGMAGLGFAYLLPGFYLTGFIPHSLLDGLEPGPGSGVLVVFVVSFLVWWLMLGAAVFAIARHRARRRPGA